jgi:hypothetical protein
MTDPCETTITPTLLTSAGVQLTTAAANSCGSKFKAYAGRALLRIKNTGAQMTATIHNLAGGTDMTLIIPATTGDQLIILETPADFTDNDGYAHVTFSRDTSVEIGIFKVPLSLVC